MSLPVLVAIAGVLVAAAGTGLLAGQCVRIPRISFIAWTIGMFALTVALLAQSIGFSTGFGSASFRAIQVAAQLVAPVTLTWGLVELVARGAASRFGARLVAAGLTIVVGVVLATDPLTAKPFGKTWPSASAHYQLIAHDALILLHLVVVVAAVTAVAVCAARRRSQPAMAQILPGAAAVGVAVLLAVALRFALPVNAAYPALSAISAGLIWLGMSRLDELLPAAAGTGHGGSGRAGPDRASTERAGDRGDGRGQREPVRDPAGSWTRDQRRADGEGPDRSRRPDGSGFRPDGFDDPRFPGHGRRGRDVPARPRYVPGAPGAEPGTGAIEMPGAGLARAPVPVAGRSGPAGTDLARPATRPHGLIAIYTLLEDKVADFDRIAEQAAEQVRTNEPDTLVYVIHTVPKAPMQRIFYEVYRDRAAYERHEAQPYIKRFVTARRPYVLATNVIELRLKYAKVSPLGQADGPGPGPAGERFPADAPAGHNRSMAGTQASRDRSAAEPLAGRDRGPGDPRARPGAPEPPPGNPPVPGRPAGRDRSVLPPPQRRYDRI